MTANDFGLNKAAYDIDEVCEAIGVGRNTIYNLINTGRLLPAYIGSRTLVPTPEIVKLLTSSPRPEGGPRRGGRRPRSSKPDAST